MKKIIYIIFIALCSSCNLLDVEPENSVTYTNYFKSELELESVTSQMHAFIRDNLVNTYQTPHEFAGAFADETELHVQGYQEFNPESFSSESVEWKELYDIIYMANVMLDNIHRTENVTSERINFHRGQACFGKGISYFFLARRFGNAIITEDSKTMTAYGNSTALAVIDTAISNGLQAYNLLPKYEDSHDRNGTKITSKQYGNKGSAAALLAHAYAWKGSIIDLYGLQGDSRACYDQAIAWAGKIISGEAGSYDLQPTPEELCLAISAPRTHNQESIFELELDETSLSYAVSGSFAIFYVSWPVNIKKSPGDINSQYLRITNTTVNATYGNGDLRKQAFFYEPKPGELDYDFDPIFAYPYKYREGLYYSSDNGEKTWQSLKANTMVWRLADIYLLRAECYAKIGDEAGATADLNKVRQRAKATLYPNASGDGDIQLAVFREREKELLFEGHRYYDVIRNGENYIMTELYAGKRHMISHSDILTGILYLPIPAGAFKMNDKLRQNVYWAKYE